MAAKPAADVVGLFLIAIIPSTPIAIIPSTPRGARCSSVVRAFAHGAMGRRIDPSWGGGPIELISRSSQCSTTGVTEAVVCAILSVGWCI